MQAQPFLLRAGESRFGQPNPFLGVNPNDLKVSAQDTGGALSVFDYVGIQRVGPVLHRHLLQEEAFFVVEGEYLFQLGDEYLRLGAGDTIFLPRGVSHTWVQVSEQGRVIYFLQPAGKIEEFFTGLSTPGADFARLSVEAGIENTGPELHTDGAYETVATPSVGLVVRAGRDRFGEAIRVGGVSPNHQKIGSSDTDGALCVFEYIGCEPGGPPLHVHPNQDEVFHVLDGEYRFRCGTSLFTLLPGEMIFLPRGVPHTFAQVGAQGRLLYYFTPAGKMEGFFRAIGRPLSPEEGAQAFVDHDMQLVGPPL
jgi:quercetin dioxygenase-like cupin family protein